jgi:hypothetical protein
MRDRDSYPFPVGLVGRVVAGPEAGFYIEVDDDTRSTRRPKGTGGFYILTWNGSVGYDEWYETAEDAASGLSARTVEWLSEAESAAIPGRHRHDETSA